MTVCTIGVVVAAYDADRWIEQCLASLQAQSIQDWQCVVVDDGSTDRTAALALGCAAADPRIQVVQQANQGVAAARNRGLSELPPQVELVAFLDSDDLYQPDGLAVLLAHLQTRPDAVGAFGLAEYVDASGEPVGPGLHPARQLDRRVPRGRRLAPLAKDADSTFADLLVYGPIWPCAVALLRRGAVDRAGRFDPELAQREDWDLHLRMSRLGPFALVPAQVAWYRRHDQNLTGRAVSNQRQTERVIAKVWQSADTTADQLQLLRTAQRWRRAAELRATLRVAQRSVLARQWRAAGLALLAGGGLAVPLLRGGPHTASPRRIRWSLGGHDQEWSAVS